MDAFGAEVKMKILFTSDIHEDLVAYDRFVYLLKERNYDIGIISGDLMEYDLTIKEMESTPGVHSDDLLEELYDPEDSIDDLNERVIRYRKNRNTPLYKTIKYKENKIRKILKSANKPIVIIPGNHDIADWHSDNVIHNVHNKGFQYMGYNFIGFKYTSLEISQRAESRYIKRVERKIINKTILVTHAPPYGILDMNYRQEHIGSKVLARIHTNQNIVLHLFGHVHHSFGFSGKAANGSYVKEKKYIEINTDEIKFNYIE
jgi:Icc-related predicted phosphoesterase